MLLTGRILGCFMVLFGALLLLRYYSEWAATGHMIPVAMNDLWQGTDNLMLNFMERSVLQRFSAAMLSGWAAALLIIFGALLVWGCRRGPARR